MQEEKVWEVMVEGVVVIAAAAVKRWAYLKPSVDFAVEFEDGREGSGRSVHRNGKVETATYIGAICMGNNPYVYNHRTASRAVSCRCNTGAFTVAAQRRGGGWHRHSSSTGGQSNPCTTVQAGEQQSTIRVKQRQHCQAYYGWSRNCRMI